MSRRSGYTLIEMLVAMIILAIVTTAVSFALTTAMRGYNQLTRRSDDLIEIRSLFRVISADLRAAYASAGNPNTFFLGTGQQDGNLLAFTTLSNRIAVDPNSLAASSTDKAYLPQSDLAVVSYSFDSSTREVHRTVSAVPNADALPQAGSRGSLIAQRVNSLTLEYVDPNQGTRTEWGYVTQATSAGTQSEMLSNITAQDTLLPQSVRVTIELLRPEGVTTFATTVPLTNTVPQPKGQAPAAATAPTGGGGGGGGGQ